MYIVVVMISHYPVLHRSWLQSQYCTVKAQVSALRIVSRVWAAQHSTPSARRLSSFICKM